MTRLLAPSLLAACIAACLATAHAAPAAPDPATDPAGAWAHVLRHGDYGDVIEAFAIVSDVAYDGESVDEQGCRTHRAKLESALEAAPVSLAMWRIAYLCADATGDTARGDRAEAVLAALARHALAQGGDPAVTPPMRMLVPLDSSALLATMGAEQRYAYYLDMAPAPYLRYAVVVDDEAGGRERHLVFDEVDTAARMDREDPNHGTPLLRHAWADGNTRGGAENGVSAEQDLLAVREAVQAGTPEQRVGLLRQAARDGGLNSASTLLTMCAHGTAEGCEEVVDALLERAEQRQAVAMSLLAFAQVNGIGTVARPDDGWKLLDRADARWGDGQATANFAVMQGHAYPAKPMPDVLLARLQALAGRGVNVAQRLLAARRAAAEQPLTEADIALLQRADQNGNGLGYRLLAAEAHRAKREDDSRQWLERAADAGDAFAMAQLGARMLEAGDAARGAVLLREAANAGNLWAARMLGSRAAMAGNAAESERWLRGAALSDDVDAAFLLASLYESEPAGIEGKVADAVRVYEILADEPAHGARARRQLAVLAMQGHGVKKDPARARALVADDARGGDIESQVIYAAMLLRGQGGKADVVEGERMMQAALSAGNEDAGVELGNWLYHVQATPEARARALALWKGGAERGHGGAINNYAWARCVSPHADVRNGTDGLAWARKLGAPEALHFGTLDTVAACHAAAGNFGEAARLQVMAQAKLEAVGQTKAFDGTRTRFAERLALYREGKAYTDPGNDPADGS